MNIKLGKRICIHAPISETIKRRKVVSTYRENGHGKFYQFRIFAMNKEKVIKSTVAFKQGKQKMGTYPDLEQAKKYNNHRIWTFQHTIENNQK